MDQKRIAKAVAELLDALGEDTKREGLRETPQRVARMYTEICGSLGKKPEDLANYKVFHVDDVPEFVLVQRIPFYSLCEHHLLPFFGYANVAYVPKNGRVIGLSKIPRLLDFCARKPGMQERLTTEIVKELTRILDPAGVAVTINARHLCMEMRGINKTDQFTSTAKYTGEFKTDHELKEDFLHQTRGGRGNGDL